MKEILKKLKKLVENDEKRCKKLLQQIQYTNQMLNLNKIKEADIDQLYLTLTEFEKSISQNWQLVFNIKQKYFSNE